MSIHGGTEIGTRLRELRLKQGSWLGVRRLARLAGVSHSVISEVEHGKQRPTPGFLYAVAPHLGTSPNELLQLAGYLDDSGCWTEPERRADPLTKVKAALAEGPWPPRLIDAVVALLQAWPSETPAAQPDPQTLLAQRWDDAVARYRQLGYVSLNSEALTPGEQDAIKLELLRRLLLETPGP